MACRRPCRWRIRKGQIADKRADTDRKHDPAVVCHEQQPAGRAGENINKSTTITKHEKAKPRTENVLHDEEGIEDLNAVQRGRHELAGAPGRGASQQCVEQTGGPRVVLVEHACGPGEE